MGSQAEPQQVRVILAAKPELSYPAEKTADGWSAKLEIPDTVSGDIDLRVEVVVNNRLFTPIKKRISIASAPSAATPAHVDAPATKSVPAEVPASAAPVSLDAKPSILKQFEAEKIELEGLAKLAKKPAKPFTVSGMPAGVKRANSVSEKIKVRIADIDKLASQKFDADLAASETYVSPVKESVATPVKTVMPVKLVKTHITYE